MDAVQEKPIIKGKHVAITGILAFYKRQEALDQIEACGGYSQNNVTQNTDYLVVGYYRPNSIIRLKESKTMARKYYNDNYSVLGIEKGEMLKSSQKKAPEDEKIFVRYDEGAKRYSMCRNSFMRLAADAGAVYKINKISLVNIKIFEEYLETFRVEN